MEHKTYYFSSLHFSIMKVVKSLDRTVTFQKQRTWEKFQNTSRQNECDKRILKLVTFTL